MTSLRFLARVLAIVGAIGAAKVAAHQLGWEVISLNALFTGIIAANVFLMGFLLSGVLADYKESERMPGEISACLENMAQEVAAMGIGKPEAQIGPCLHHLSRLADDLLAWFYKKIDTDGLLVSLNGLTAQFAALEPWTQATFIARLKQEQSNLRRTMTRIETIRDTSFVSAGYLLADLITLLLCGGLVLISMDPFYESLLFALMISFLLVFLLLLIRDLDNPFGYSERFSSADVPLTPLQRTAVRLARLNGGPETVSGVGPAGEIAHLQPQLP
jgi:hypothetical protein